MRKLLILVLCGFAHRSACTRVRFEQVFHEPMYRPDSAIHNDAIYKREHFFPREPLVQAEQILPQQGMMRNEPIYGSERIMSFPPPPPPPPPMPAQPAFSNEDFLQNDQIVQSEPIIQNDAFIRGDSILRREPFIRREPIFRREPFIRNEPAIRRGRICQNGPVLREGRIFRGEPNTYAAVMMAQCQCQEAQRMEQAPPQETFFQIPQPIHQQPIMGQLIIPKQAIKPQIYQPIMAFPRVQRFMRKSYKPIQENFQFGGQQVQNTPEFSTFSSEPVSFPGNYQNQGSQPENTSEPSQNQPVTVRTVPQMPNALTLAQMSSIC